MQFYVWWRYKQTFACSLLRICQILQIFSCHYLSHFSCHYYGQVPLDLPMEAPREAPRRRHEGEAPLDVAIRNSHLPCAEQLSKSDSDVYDMDNRWSNNSPVYSSWSTAEVICPMWITGGKPTLLCTTADIMLSGLLKWKS